ncbi:DNA polymerase III subunit delta' [Nitrospira sp.]|nr:DNA polymerase III subunit delta' [Nitrospira sp.]
MPFADVVGHDRAKSLLQLATLNNRIAHAYLFHGPDRIGKRLLAVRFIQAMCCEAAQGLERRDACGCCRSCRHIEQGSHPDFCVVTPDTSGATPRIKIEEIRELESRLIYRPLIAERKYCLIDDAESLTIEAANALLKTLEEPPGYALLILIASRPYALPATIRSRCQSLRFTALSQAQSCAALIEARRISEADAQLLAAVSEGRFGEALTTDLTALRERHEALAALTAPRSLRSVSAILAAAEALAKNDEPAADALDRLASWVHDLVFVQIGMPPERLAHPNHLSTLRTVAATADIDLLLDVLSDIETFQRNSTRNLNHQLMLEHILLRLRDATNTASVAR